MNGARPASDILKILRSDVFTCGGFARGTNLTKFSVLYAKDYAYYIYARARRYEM